MSVFAKRREKKWFRYKDRLKFIIGEEQLELEPWLQKLIMSIVEKEEQKHRNDEMAAWLVKWEKEGDLPSDFKDEVFLSTIHRNHTEWVEETAQFHADVRKADYESLESLIADFGEPITSMSTNEQKTYIALWGEILNAISQVE
ncbi:hypothetical protein LG329_00300 [Virgibacillus necropolis]|uniref:hypothetical protein n=1 Tax=Virgibacillus necropolis TaxID=163877 RepID=UPI00384A71CA